jgi:hypothetical protein
VNKRTIGYVLIFAALMDIAGGIILKRVLGMGEMLLPMHISGAILLVTGICLIVVGKKD